MGACPLTTPHGPSISHLHFLGPLEPEEGEPSDGLDGSESDGEGESGSDSDSGSDDEEDETGLPGPVIPASYAPIIARILDVTSAPGIKLKDLVKLVRLGSTLVGGRLRVVWRSL